jgi:subtilisin family serine protease
MSSALLARQIQRILDESRAATLSVILQGKPPGIGRALEAMARRTLERRAVTVPGDLLPAPFETGMTAHPARAAGSTAARLATLEAAGERATRALRKSGFVSTSRLARRSDELARPRPLVLAGAAAMEIHRDDLARLANEGLGIVSVFPNRLIKPPRLIASKHIPARVELRTTHSWGLEKTEALACWGAFGARGEGAKVAVLDTGVNAGHPDLAGRIDDFARFDQRGRLVAHGVDKASDFDGHGTHVCGTVAGGNAGGRWIGMAPQARLLVARVLDPSGGTDEQILKGIEWAVAAGADVINLSLGDLSWSPEVVDTYTAALLRARQAGSLVVAAIGNDGHQTSGGPGNDLYALSVGATDIDDRVAAFSGGRTHVIERSGAIDAQYLPIVYAKPDISAPGVDVRSSVKGGWAYESGTSMAAPHVAGAAALLLSRIGPRNANTPLRRLAADVRTETIEALLMGSAVDLGENGQDHRYGFGRLSVLAAFSRAVDLKYLELA